MRSSLPCVSRGCLPLLPFAAAAAAVFLLLPLLPLLCVVLGSKQCCARHVHHHHYYYHQHHHALPTQTFPFCDGAHVAFNAAHGTAITPFHAKAEEGDKTVYGELRRTSPCCVAPRVQC